MLTAKYKLIVNSSKEESALDINKDGTATKFKIQYLDTNTGLQVLLDDLFSSEEEAEQYIDDHMDDSCDEITLLELTESPIGVIDT